MARTRVPVWREPVHHVPAVTPPPSRLVSRKGSSQVASKGGWSRRFAGPTGETSRIDLGTASHGASYVNRATANHDELVPWLGTVLRSNSPQPRGGTVL
jgi:hypothetical protein